MSSIAPMPGCPDDNTLNALMERALDAPELARVGDHLDACDSCRAAVAAAVRGDLGRTRRLGAGTPSPPMLPRTEAAFEGTRMGRYEIRSLLGAGGMGQVYCAYDGELDRTIALKVLRPELARASSGLADRLVRESRLMAKVAHPSVITVHDVGREGDAVFIAMELVRGETLAVFLARTTPGWREITALFERAGDGLAAAHDAGIVHRDFKPENVLVEADGARATKVIVTDFGIATAATIGVTDGGSRAPSAVGADPVAANARLTATGATLGTPAYMAPEQIAGAAVDRRTDVFAFAVSLWEALFGSRPFGGGTVREIRAAMTSAPRARGGVPARLVRALEHGLAIDPEERWPDMHAFVRELAAIRSTRRRTIAIGAAGAAGLVGIGIAAAVVLGGTPAEDRCATARDQLARTYDPDLARVLDAPARTRLENTVAAWRTTHDQTCKADRAPAQPPKVAACLEARAIEIEGFLDDVRHDGAKASAMARLMFDPARCMDPPSGLLVARVPVDPAARRAVSELRYRAFAIEAARDRAEYTTALPAAKALVTETTTAWPPVRAEILYLLGTTQAIGGDVTEALTTLREAAALAERAHHDYIATNSWIQLVQSTAFDEGDPERALEYATYADAALDRIGRPADVEVLLLYFKGSAMLEADRTKEAEAVLRRAVELAESAAPQYLSRAILGLGYLFEEQGRYADAVATYRRAMTLMDDGDTAAHTFRERLAINLSLIGQAEEAERVAREAVAIADGALGEDSADRATVHTTLAQVLQTIGKPAQALVEVQAGRRALVKILGERNQRYGEVLALEGNILLDLDRDAEADKMLARACEVIAFGAGEASSSHADCLLSRSLALEALDRPKQALALVDEGIEILLMIDGEPHPRVANALVQRGALRSIVGRHSEGIADLERAIAAFEQLQLEPGHLAGARWGLGQILWPRDRARAKLQIEQAIALFATASASWASSKADAEEWLRTNGHPSKSGR